MAGFRSIIRRDSTQQSFVTSQMSLDCAGDDVLPKAKSTLSLSKAFKYLEVTKGGSHPAPLSHEPIELEVVGAKPELGSTSPPACGEPPPYTPEDMSPQMPGCSTDLELARGDPDGDRGQWKGKFDFLVCLIAFAVGLGNVWRFPYLCYKNGGGAFLVPYLICWGIGSVPIFLMEVTMGQYLQHGGVGMWKVCPLFRGVGIANNVMASVCAIYYNVIIAWAMYYMYYSFSIVLPWSTCNNDFNDERCVQNEHGNSSHYDNRSIVDKHFGNFSLSEMQSPVEQFWDLKVHNVTSGISETGGMQWELVAMLALSWIITYFALWKGITNSRKLVYFCAFFPYALLAILLVRGLTLSGSGTGVAFYLKPDLAKLASTTVWRDAGTQVFYSYGIGFGAVVALGSYNPYHHNCYKDCLILCCVNAASSLTAGFVVFASLGHLAYVTGKTIDDVVKGGVGLAFLVYPEVVSLMPGSQLWSFLFFLMIFIIGMDSGVCSVEGVITALDDAFPTIVRKRKQLVVAIFCATCCLLGLPMVTQAGQFWLTLVDGYGVSGHTLLIVVFFEIMGISWGFGAERLFKALEDMIGYKVNRFWFYGWKYTAPATAVFLFVVTILKYEGVEMTKGEVFPVWAQIIGILTSLATILAIPGTALYLIARTPGSLKEAQIIGVLTSLATILAIPGTALYLIARTPGSLKERISKLMKPSVELPYNEANVNEPKTSFQLTLHDDF